MSPWSTTAGRRFRPRHLWIAAGLAGTILADRISSEHGIGLVPVVLFQVLPHVPAWIPARGRRRATLVSVFNVLHHPVVPAALAGAAVVGLVSPLWLVGGAAWLGHILIDWGLGDGVRSVAGSRHGLRIGLAIPARQGSPAMAGGDQ